MSEYINNTAKRGEKLKDVIKKLHQGYSVSELMENFNELLEGASTQEIIHIEQALIAEGLPIEQIQFLCDIHVALFKQSLDQQLPPEMQPGHPIYSFQAENEFVELLLHALDEKIENLKTKDDSALRAQIRKEIEKLQEYNKHYLRKENLLFPMLERHDFTGPSSVMWGIHDEIRANWKDLGALLQNPQTDLKEILDSYSKLQYMIREMFYKEDRILFPNALERLSEKDWAIIYAGEDEIGFAFITRGKDWKPGGVATDSQVLANNENTNDLKEMKMVELTLQVGKLSAKQVDILLRNLPVDVTFVDENDQVAFYSQSRERIFPRTPAVIGRKVQQCHPPASVDKVQKILDDFRSGARDEAEFWIQMNGRFIHIRYFAVKDENGTYCGTIEVTQDITNIRKLEGEKRLLDD